LPNCDKFFPGTAEAQQSLKNLTREILWQPRWRERRRGSRLRGGVPTTRENAYPAAADPYSAPDAFNTDRGAAGSQSSIRRRGLAARFLSGIFLEPLSHGFRDDAQRPNPSPAASILHAAEPGRGLGRIGCPEMFGRLGQTASIPQSARATRAKPATRAPQSASRG
jgi:hypothetical protein